MTAAKWIGVVVVCVWKGQDACVRLPTTNAPRKKEEKRVSCLKNVLLAQSISQRSITPVRASRAASRVTGGEWLTASSFSRTTKRWGERKENVQNLCRLLKQTILNCRGSEMQSLRLVLPRFFSSIFFSDDYVRNESFSTIAEEEFCPKATARAERERERAVIAAALERSDEEKQPSVMASGCCCLPSPPPPPPCGEEDEEEERHRLPLGTTGWITLAHIRGGG